jgi:hypothetical protein
MTPKKKAKEIFTRMYNSYDALNKYPMCFDTAKQCALIAADEILNYQPYAYTIEQYDKVNKYWEEVKSEIEKL